MRASRLLQITLNYLVILLVLLPVCRATLPEPFKRKGAYQPPKPFTVRVWPNYTSPNFTFPESRDDEYGLPDLSAKPSLGIALGGGGFRAMAMAYGQIRGLHQAGLLDQFRYATSCSGASWFLAPFSFAPASLDTFLGPTLPPERLAAPKLARLEARGSFGAAAAWANFVVDFPRAEPWVPRAQMTWWDDVVGREFLAPFGLNNRTSFFTWAGTRGGVDARAKEQLGGAVPVYVGGREGRPYPIMVATILREADARQFFPFEWTPLYVGAPGLHTTPNTTLPPIGGGYVEPLGFNSEPPGAAAADEAFKAARPRGGAVRLKLKPEWLVPLRGWAGVASGWMSQNHKPRAAAMQQLLAQNRYQYWNLADFRGGDTKFVDGGAVDLEGLMPLLRRGVKAVVLCIPVWAAPEVSIDKWSRAQFDVSGLFGVIQPGTHRTITVADDAYRPLLHVFPSADWPRLFDAYKAVYAARRSPHVRMRHRVLRNDFQGIRGGYTVDVLWVLNGRDAEWEARLPAATRAYLAATRGFDLAPMGRFPLTYTFRPDAPSEMVTMLSQYAGYQMERLAPVIRDMIVCAGGDGSGGSSGDGSGGGSGGGGGAAKCSYDSNSSSSG